MPNIVHNENSQCGLRLFRSPHWSLAHLIAITVTVTIFTIGGSHAIAQDLPIKESTIAPTVETPTITDDPPSPSTFEKIDEYFEGIVTEIDRVLFYRIGRVERQFVLYEPKVQFIRDRGTDGPFTKLNSGNDYPANALDSTQLELLSVEGKLTPGMVIDGHPELYRLGKIGDRPIEYVTIKQDEKSDHSIKYGDKLTYEPDQNQFRKLAAKRNLPTETTVPLSVVEVWAQTGEIGTGSGSQSLNDVLSTEQVGGIPLIVAWLFAAGIYFTFYMGFFNLRGMKHAVDVLRGRYDKVPGPGEVSHFQALSSALSGTVGLGNIAGVTIAMTIGGPGAFFWMLISAFLGMSLKFVECTLGVKYRYIDKDGTVLGGPMRYLKEGLAGTALAPLGVALSILFSIMCIMGSFGGGNMLQANQSGSAVLHVFQHSQYEEMAALQNAAKEAAEAGDLAKLNELLTQKNAHQKKMSQFELQFKLGFGIVLAFCVGVVVLGGIKRIGAAADKLVPGMCLLYISACTYIICMHFDQIPSVIVQVFTEAFSGKAIGGGILGVMVVGVQRAAFSNEAGVGSSPIAHSAARTGEPISQGCVAMLEPFIDTIVICSMTALVILITGAWDNDKWVVEQGLKGAALTSRAFQEEVSWFPIVLAVAVTLFAYSTIISWGYYGERSWVYLFGARSTVIYKTLMLACVVLGSVVNLGSVLDFSDMMLLGISFPNIIGLYLLGPRIKKDLQNYWARYKAGELETADEASPTA
ncbi:alanine/glycine:cation symporter family protein [Planctomicrobium sp. SH527]|uniref:alanine/glycine:cation symporter family protein n=1 Tax=Planctomicrobium sp. SH527 TaxID=3448123 RepID=UPI003F5B7F33